MDIPMHAILVGLTLVSVTAAATAAGVAWRVTAENRRRSDARVARLADMLRQDEEPDSAPVATSHLLEPSDPTPGARWLPLALAAAGLCVVSATLTLAGRSGTRPASTGTAAFTAGAPTTARSGPTQTVDLVALTHERGPGGALELRGEVRARPDGAMMDGLTAVALLFDRQGAYLTSSRAPLVPRVARSHAAASFVIMVPDASRVGRYRVSFRDGERIVPHVDRRSAARPEAGS